MPKKKSRSESPRRWNLYLGGTNVLPPLGTEWENRWPDWLSKSFVNISLLQQDPINLREELFGSLRDPGNQWGLVDNLLYVIELEATKVLDEDERRYIPGLTENQFENFYLGQSNTAKQANAIAALRSIEVIRSLTHVFDNHGYQMCDPHGTHTYESLTVAKIIMEATTLIMAAIRGELWEDVWTHADRHAEQQRHLRETSPKGTAARISLFMPIKQFCRHRWSFHHNKSQRAVHEMYKELGAELKKPPSLRIPPLDRCRQNQKPPAIKTIRSYIQDLR